MTRKPIDNKEARRYLDAFADGELDVDQNLRTLEHMAMNPLATRRVMHQQQLRQAADRTLRSGCPETPDSLRKRINELAETIPAESSDSAAAPALPVRSGVAGRIGRWIPVAAAAGLFFAALITFNSSTTPPPAGSPAFEAGLVLPAAQFTAFGRRHIDCSKLIENLSRSVSFPNTVTELPAFVSHHLGRHLGLASLDLSSLGYRFAGAGPCNVPGDNAVHLVYHNTSTPDTPDTQDSPAPQDSLSLWIRRYTGHPAIMSGKAYTVSGPEAAHEVLIWRQGEVVYYLVGNPVESTQEAANQLRLRG